jgi:cardiolipin synthase A/B
VVEKVTMEKDLNRAGSVSPQEKRNNNRTTYEVIAGSKAILNDLKSEIKTAKNLDLLFYVFEGDVVGRDMAMNLSTAASSGVNTRLLVDRFIDFYHNDRCIPTSIFNQKLHRQLVKDKKETYETLNGMTSKGVDIKLINPLGIFYNKLFNRDHRKLIVKDGSNGEGAAYLGSMNICDHEANWQNLMVKMRGEAVSILQEEFNSAWEGKNISKKVAFSDGFVVTDTKGASLIIPEVEKMINTSSNKVVLVSPYLWGKRMEKSLMNAVERDVDVSIILPLKNNHKGHIFVPDEKMVRRFISNGIQVFMFAENEGMIHSKALIADDTTVFGSSNFNEFTAGKNTETIIISNNLALSSQMESLFAAYISKSVQL